MPVLEANNVAELIAHLGVPAERIRMRPLPGTATENDVVLTRPLCELIDGVLVATLNFQLETLNVPTSASRAK